MTNTESIAVARIEVAESEFKFSLPSLQGLQSLRRKSQTVWLRIEVN